MNDKFLTVLPHYIQNRDGWYHNLDHITDLLKNAQNYGVLTEKLYTAILYHDIVYEIPKPDDKKHIFLYNSNEFKSAELYINHGTNELINMLGNDNKSLVVDLILATRHHFDDNIEYDDPETNWMLDLDVLGFSESDFYKFVATQKRIDKEYLDNGYTQEQVDKGRYDFLLNIYNNKILQYRIIPDAKERTQIAYFNIESLLDQYVLDGKV